MKRIFVMACGSLVVLMLALIVLFNQYLRSPLSLPDKGMTYNLVAGGSLARAAYQLSGKGVLKQPRWLIGFARITGRTKVISGEYQIPQGTTPLALLALLESGAVRRYRVTLLEGWTFHQALSHIHNQQKITPLLKGLTTEAQLSKFELPIQHPEGWFFPDTYSYTSGATDVDLLLRAHRKMQSVLTTAWEGRAEGLPYDNPYQALIMASIVERETGQSSERGQIAGVFVRRLQKNMRLQTDPTVIYGLGPEFDGNIRKRHLKQSTPYNTYMIKGLPPTPIALPGEQAVYAALHPDNGNALFFVAKGDGSHYFSASLEEHNKAVKQYQVFRRVKDYRSSPAVD